MKFEEKTDSVTPVIDVAAGLIFRQGKLLITKRYDDAHLGGLWEFPGGKREPKESFEQCLVRELHEELGIEVTVGELVESITHEYPGKTVHLKFFVCEWQKNEPQALGCSECKWVKAEDIASIIHFYCTEAASAIREPVLRIYNNA